ncbi:hypothetical protein BG005_008085 [Podila minutissima]|nr:hypothetical protein BG005_008085 [Podila minutissima]
MLTSLTIVYSTIFDEREDNSVPRLLCAIPALLHLHAESDEKRGGSVVMTTAPRILCGYLSRLCPRLEDLSIQYIQLDMTLQGGFCLLTRLGRLRRLRLSLRLSRMQKMLRAYKVTFSLDKKGVDNGPVAVLEAGLEKGISTRYLGHLADVGEALAEILEMSRDDATVATRGSSSSVWGIQLQRHVWPDLANISIVFSNPVFKEEKRFVERLLKRHRPEVCFEWA